MTQAPSPNLTGVTTILAPSYKLPLGLVAVAFGLTLLLSQWLGTLVFFLAIFLAVQSTILRLHFTPTAMELYRNDQLLRQFPYGEWLNWQIFWSPVPILFYFKEVKSIHFLPILFNPDILQTCLSTYCPVPGKAISQVPKS
jgi:hypothetical protein